MLNSIGRINPAANKSSLFVTTESNGFIECEFYGADEKEFG